jgi:crotonobetaine/carnitine-CoA ligase
MSSPATTGTTSVHGTLEAAVEADPEAPAVWFVDGPGFTRQQLLTEVRRVAGGLAAAGVTPGDRIAILVGNRPEFLVTYLAISSLGAVSVPINTAMRGDVLTYMLEMVGPCRLVLEADYYDAVPQDLAEAGTVLSTWWIPSRQGDQLPLDALAFSDLRQAEPLRDSHVSGHAELLSILFTSGTTGPSKGVMWSHRTALAFSENATWVMGYTARDTIYTCLPLFHINALFTAFLAGLQQGAPVVVSPRFSASRFWREITDSGATVTNMLGAMGAILWKQEPQPEESTHRLRLAMVVPFPKRDHIAFEQRFGMLINELYGSTDTSIPIGIPHGERRPGSCGRPAPGWEVALVDAMDEPVPPGVPGELVTRPSRPFIGQLGYWSQPDKTWEAHRNAWFHTGDMLIQDDDGWFYFQDRLKDALRVSGENVSSFEVEQVLSSHPAVAEVAVYGVPSDLGEDSVMACVVPESGHQLEPSDLVDFASGRLPYFAVPRYVDLVDQLPKTSTQKIRKQELRSRGISTTTWDGGQRRSSSAR